MYGALNFRSGSTLASRRSVRRFFWLGPTGITDLIEPAELVQPYGHERGRHREVGADVLLARQRLLVLGEPLLVVVEVFLVVHRDAGRGLEGSDETVGHVQRPVRDPQRAAGRAAVLRRRLAGLTAVRRACGEERRAEGERGGGRRTSADEAATGGSVGREPGSQFEVDRVNVLGGHGDCAFRRGERGDGRSSGSGVVEHLFEVFGGGDVRCGEDQ